MNPLVECVSALWTIGDQTDRGQVRGLSWRSPRATAAAAIRTTRTIRTINGYHAVAAQVGEQSARSLLPSLPQALQRGGGECADTRGSGV